MANSKDLTVDGELVRALASLLQETGLTEIEYAVGERRIRVVRGVPAAAVTLAVPGMAAAALAVAAPAAPVAAADLPGALKAPMVGTAYLSPQPEAPPFIKVGDSVREGQPLLIIEAMKVMNQIAAPRAGRVTQILVADGTPVEYGQPLLVLEQIGGDVREGAHRQPRRDRVAHPSRLSRDGHPHRRRTFHRRQQRHACTPRR